VPWTVDSTLAVAGVVFVAVTPAPLSDVFSGKFWVVGLLLCMLGGGFLSPGCTRAHSEHRGDIAAQDAGLSPAAPMPTRAEVVARADNLVLTAEKSSPQVAGRLLLEAASLRTRIWRMEGRETDATEAMELLKQAVAKSSLVACEANVALATLEGELRGDPSATYRRLYVLSRGEGNEQCKGAASRGLALLASYRPDAKVLAQLGGGSGEMPDGGANGTATVALESDKQLGPIVLPEAAAGSGPAKVTSFERYGAKDAARVVVHMTHPTAFEVGFLPGKDGAAPRLFVDVKNASYEGPASQEVGGLLERVRVGKQPEGIRIVLDLQSEVYRKVLYLPEPFRLIIDVSRNAPAGAQASHEPRTLRRIAIDAGHGGHDPGAIGPNGLREKDVTLDIAHRVAPILARELGISALLTRDSDVFVPLAERTARANAFGADLFVSIHCNASPDPSAHGIASFVLDASRDSSAAVVAARENDASAEAASELATAMSRVLDQSSVGRAVSLADLLQRSALASLGPAYGPVRDQGVRRAGFYVLAGAQMPAVLYEVSFISNPLEEVRLNTADYRQKLADSIANAIRAYRDGIQ